MSEFLADNLRALRARIGHDPVLGPAEAPIVERPEDLSEAARRLDDAVGAAVPSTVFLIGCGLGAMIDAIAHQYPSADVIVLEPDPATASRLLERRDWTQAFRTGRLALFVGPDYQGASGHWRPSRILAGEQLVIVDPALADRLPEETRKAEHVVARVIEEGRANAEARRVHAGRYLLHTLANASAVAREGDVASLAGAFRGRPAMIVGAGPSLDGRLEELRSAADRCVIIAAAAAARPLSAAGICPQFIVAVDPTELHATHLFGLQTRASWLVGEGSLHPTAFATFDRRSFVFNVSEHHPWPWLGLLGIARGRLATWGSAATSALDLAITMGCAPVLLAGLDFAFTGGKPYCRGTTFEPQWAVRMGEGFTFDQICQQIVNRWPLTLEPDVDGRMERTAPHLVSFRNWMRQQIESAAETRFMHVTPGGILHHRFIEHCTVDEALGASPALDLKEADALIRVRHRATPSQSERLYLGIDAIVEGEASGEHARRLDEWSAFAGGTVRKDLLLTALRSHEYHAWVRGRRTPDLS